MTIKKIELAGTTTRFYFNSSINELKKITAAENVVVITDENVMGYHARKLKMFNTIVIKAGEAYKNQSAVDEIIERLIELRADRKTLLIGIGGGVVTDITGYVAAVYMRGIQFGFVPTTILSLVDASIGGKNGIDVGLYKNLVGTIRQPDFLLHDLSLLKSLPHNEWVSGFAEIIKHACIKDATMFKQLQQHNIGFYKKNKTALAALIQRNALIKCKVVQADPFEKNERRLLNFGHTLGHAIENMYQLSHGQAIAIGMVYAARLSQLTNGFKQVQALIDIFNKYELPVTLAFDYEKVNTVLTMDKKRENNAMNYILLDKIGRGIIMPIPLPVLNENLSAIQKTTT